MKGVLLAASSFISLVGVSMVLLRLYQGRKYFKVFLVAFGMAVAVFSYLFRVLPDDLGFLSAEWLEPNATLNFLNGLLVLVLLFHSFWDGVYTTALTGFSANLMVLLARAGGLSREELSRVYGAGETMDRVLAWRLPNLLQGGYLEADGPGFRLRAKGWVVGFATRLVKRILTGSEEGG